MTLPNEAELTTSFAQQIAAKVHSNLVLRKHLPPVISATETPPTESNASLRQATSLRAKVAAAVAIDDLGLTLPSALVDDDVIVKGREQKRQILQDYEEKFGGEHPHPVISKQKGKHSHDKDTTLSTRMAPSIQKHYRVIELTLCNVITTVIREYRTSMTISDIQALSSTNRYFSRLIPKTIGWLHLDFSPLRNTRYDYESQTEISSSRVEMASAAMIHFGLDPGKLVRWLGGEYTGASRDVHRTLTAVKDHVSADDFNHIRRILMNGSPAELTFDEPLANKTLMIQRGNSKSFNENQDLVAKTMNKEDRYSHVLPFDELLSIASPFCRHTMQTLVVKEGKNDRIAFDASTTFLPTDIVLNHITPTTNEAPITFGSTKMRLLVDIYNTRISYPDAPILLGSTDIKACFRFPRIHADLTGAFGFNAGGYYFLATAMVFGSTASASSWEPFRRAIEELSAVYANRPKLVQKHKKYLDMINWATIDPTIALTRAVACDINQGVLDRKGLAQPLPARIFVDDSFLLAITRWIMMMALAALIEAIFVVMGDPDTAVRQCPLALDKWVEMVVGPVQPSLGLILDTNRLTVAIPCSYVNDVRRIINATWHATRRTFVASEAQQLAGKLGHLAEGAPWVHHLMTHLYASIAYALAENKRLLTDSSQEFRDVVKSLTTGTFHCSAAEQGRHIAFALKRAARMVHHARYKFFINGTMRQEIEFFRDKLQPDSTILWETPIAHVIPRMPTATAFGDSCLEGAGGYSIELGFWWHIDFPEEVKRRTLLFKSDNEDGTLVSINVLKFVTVIINYLASVHVITTTNFTDDPHPVLLNVTDNMSALKWTTGACRKSSIGRRLARFFCSLLINAPVGINSKWISTAANEIADDISRLKKLIQQQSNNSHASFDYLSLKQRYPALSHCSFFQIEPKLISLIWDIVLNEKWPEHTEIKSLLQRPLGRLTTSNGVR